jgi:hypothetical protein
MMIANTNQTVMRPRPVEHRTEPRIVLQMQNGNRGSAKLKPTVFLPSALLQVTPNFSLAR